jgi:hypothetical protein
MAETEHAHGCLLLLVAPTVLLLDACAPSAGSSGQAATQPWNRFAPYRPGLVRIGPGGGPVLSDMPAYGSPIQQPSPTLPAVYHTMTDKCRQLSHTRDYTDRMRLAREIAAYPDVDVAFAGIPIVPEFPGGRYVGHFTTGSAAASYADCLGGARGDIGELYFFGSGVAQDYAEAARWFEKAISTQIPPDSGGGIIEIPRWKMELGVLYAYGLGVAKDPQHAQQLWSDSTEVGPRSPPGRICSDPADEARCFAKDHGRLE